MTTKYKSVTHTVKHANLQLSNRTWYISCYDCFERRCIFQAPERYRSLIISKSRAISSDAHSGDSFEPNIINIQTVSDKHVFLATKYAWLNIFIARQHSNANTRCRYRNSVCMSVWLAYFGIVSKRLNKSSQFLHHTVAQSFYFYEYQTSQNSDGVTPCRGTKYMWGIKILRFSTNNSPHLANDTRKHHSYYGTLIGIHMQSIEWCHFQWPWVTHNLDFKVTELL